MSWVPLAHISYPNTDFNKSSDCSPVMDVEILGATDNKTTGFRGTSAREQMIYCK